MKDPDQKTTYAAEDMVMAWLDEVSAETGEVLVSVTRDGGRRQVAFSPEVEPRFTGDVEARAFVDKVMERLRQQAKDQGPSFRGRENRKVHVVVFDAVERASYGQGIIFLPERNRGGAWALRGMVVLHELAHHLNTGLDGAIIDEHGEGFRATFLQLLENIGWVEIAAMLREAYRQSGLDGEAAEDEMLAKVGKLLRHAEGASTEAERDAFFSKAQELATLNSIELAVAQAALEGAEGRQTPTFETVRLGHRGQPSNVRFIELMTAVTDANDLKCSIRVDHTGVTLYGFQGDIDVAKAMYVSLVVQMVADADAYIRSGAHRPVHGRTARVAFYEGWTDRIGQRLLQAQHAARVRAGADTRRSAATGGQAAGKAGTKALALAAKEVEVKDYYDYMLRQRGIRRTWRGGSRTWDGHSAARGSAAADRAKLRRERELESS